jgi:hypothetical protein
MTHQKSATNIYQGALLVKFQGVLTAYIGKYVSSLLREPCHFREKIWGKRKMRKREIKKEEKG